MKKILWIMGLLIMIPSIVLGKEWDKGELYAISAALADGENGRVLYGKNEDEFRSIASTTKIMTAVIALEEGESEQICNVSKYAASMPSVKLGLREGEQYYLKDLLYAVMLESDNDAAVAIAEAVGGSVEGFARVMNEKAKEIGANKTNFVTPNGLDAAGQGSTASDLAKIAAYAIKKEEFCELINTRSHTFSSLDGKRTFSVSNKNAFLDQMEGAFGIKTGYTGEAGYCFVGALKEGERTFISVVLGSGWPPNKNAKWKDTKNLMAFGLDNYQKEMVLEADSIRKIVEISGGTRDYVLAKGRQGYEGLAGESERGKLKYIEGNKEKAPVYAESTVGKAQLYIGGSMVFEQDLYVDSTVKKEKTDRFFLEIYWLFFSFHGI